jgi:F-type H+-transporting ATPase subunit gamma
MKHEAYVYRMLPPEGYLGSSDTSHIIEPDKRSLTDALFRHLLACRLYHFYLDSMLGEVSSRMVILKGAVESSKDLIDELVININKLRQQTITSELPEVVSSSESLRKEEN